MTQEEKDLLLRDLCARLPYGVKVLRPLYGSITLTCDMVKLIDRDDNKWLPYLRPMSSMTEEEEKVFNDFLEFQLEYVSDADLDNKTDMYDWLNAHHFDYRGLIEKGLAIEAPAGMYNLNKE